MFNFDFPKGGGGFVGWMHSTQVDDYTSTVKRTNNPASAYIFYRGVEQPGSSQGS